MQTIVNMQNGLSLPQREALLGGSWVDGIPIEHANWEELLGYGAGYSQEMQNHIMTADNVGGVGNLDSVTSFQSASSNYMNGSISNTGEADFKATVAERYWNSSWSHLLSSMTAPSASPDIEYEIVIPSQVSNSTNKQNILSLTSSEGTILAPAEVYTPPSMTSMHEMASRNAGLATQLGILDSVPEQSSSQMQANVASSLLLNQNGNLASHEQQGNSSFRHTHQEEYSNTHHPQYNRNSPQRPAAEVASGITNSAPIKPATPEQARRAENYRFSAAATVDLSPGTPQRKRMVLSADGKTMQQCYEPAQHVVETSSTNKGAQLEDKNNSGLGANQEFDLNKTPPQKTPRRRKHRPKVVKEGKPKRGRKPMNQQESESNNEKQVKRKYVRKNIPKATDSPAADAVKETNDAISKSAPRACRRSLNFEEKKTTNESNSKQVCQSEGKNQRSQTHLVTANSEDPRPSSGHPNAAMSTIQRHGQNEQILGNKEVGFVHRQQNLQPVHAEQLTTSGEHTPSTQTLMRLKAEMERITASRNTEVEFAHHPQNLQPMHTEQLTISGTPSSQTMMRLKAEMERIMASRNKKVGLEHHPHKLQSMHAEQLTISGEHTPSTQTLMRLKAEMERISASKMIQRAPDGSHFHVGEHVGASQSLDEQIETGAGQSLRPQIQTGAAPSLPQQIQTGGMQSLPLQIQAGVGQYLHPQIQRGAGQCLHPQIQTEASQSLHPQIQQGASRSLHPQSQTGAQQSLNPQIQTRQGQSLNPQIQARAGGFLHQQIQTGATRSLYHQGQPGINQSLYHRVQSETAEPPNNEIQAGIGQSLDQKRIMQEKLQRIMRGMAEQLKQTTPQICQGRGFKRDYHLTAEGDNANSILLGYPMLLNQEVQVHEQSNNQGALERDPEDHKKRRVDSGYYTTRPSAQRIVGSVDHCLRQVQASTGHHILVNQLENGSDRSSNENNCENNCLNLMIAKQHMITQRNIQREHNLTMVGPPTKAMGGKRASTGSSSLIRHITAKADPNVQCASQSNTNAICIDGQGTRVLCTTSPSIISAKKQERVSRSKHMKETAGSLQMRNIQLSIDEIICRFQYLNLNPTEGALVPYKGTGTMVPYEAFDPIKRRKPRPKVDLDPETDRKWKLLMGKEASNDDEDMDAEKAKRWEEERKVFRGRADSFIARMHLVQGDRRFSRWKGSVVDSVIGVFLTQNVTDHLSSSAFMSLAARFPIQSTKNSVTSRHDSPSIIVEEPEYDSNSAVGWPMKSINPIESADNRRYGPSLDNILSTSGEIQNWGVEEVISSQDSAESSTIEVPGRIQSSSGWQSREHYATNGLETASNCSSTSFIHLESENIARCHDSTGQVPQNSSTNWVSRNNITECGSLEKNMNAQQGENNMNTTLASTAYPFDLNMPHPQEPVVHSTDFQFTASAQSELTEVQSSTMWGNESIRFLASNVSEVGNGTEMEARSRTIGLGDLGNYVNGRTQRQGSPDASDQGSNHQNCNGNHQCGETMVSKLVNRSDNELSQQQYHEVAEVSKVYSHGGQTYKNKKIMSVEGKEVPAVNKIAVYEEQLGSSIEAQGEANTKIPKTKGAKIETDKKTAFDWDSLRRQVLSEGLKRERSKDAMDSIDYETIRQAPVNEISEAIKERGMNHMLADRIKAFLDRLVTDHGSIDLEWLKEVPPQKSKDYLLSIWGLGLKSVECVRLLTLHQHAFPVDTNVGRIAVRLGWVPLQPLPESLQLHLLELYPVLESIQKYLWPRLCTLDQRTLYELHYQLITFGKVFCTKSKPNCNACPLRGECRHFASAFTSARFALPGPEEQSIVVSAVPIQTERQPMVGVNPVQMLPIEHKQPGAVFEPRSSEPIVEEPRTPEPEVIDLSETDIEDAFFEDPDEIPTIKLSAEDITTLKNYIKENVELEEGDMSKALVALNPEAAYIPEQKLKNVSRLRTEHLVYELPDTHPLLKQMDKREPDDPSPYLLAIWTPGETANSIVPPEVTCKVQDSGKLCTETTCFSCNSKRESNKQIVRGTILIPCRTTMRGSFPLNGTYFQVNEVFADHDSSLKPIDVPRELLWNLPRRTVFFGTSVSTIFKGMSTEDIQYCFWRGFVCVRGFDRMTRAPRPLIARLHFPASKMVKEKKDIK
ncbi:Transcriptional activator DEMETER-like protein [Drosera capensis]